MRALGYLLITAGFLAGAFLAVREPESVALAPFLAALAVGGAGIALVRLALRRAARDVTVLTANIRTIEGSLERIAEDARELAAEKDRIDVYDLRHRIDDLFPEHLDAFVQARESIAHSFGLQAYSEVMNRFAAGERSLNRVWSASTDGYPGEAHEYIERARDQFRDALETFRRVRTGAVAG